MPGDSKTDAFAFIHKNIFKTANDDTCFLETKSAINQFNLWIQGFIRYMMNGEHLKQTRSILRVCFAEMKYILSTVHSDKSSITENTKIQVLEFKKKNTRKKNAKECFVLIQYDE